MDIKFIISLLSTLVIGVITTIVTIFIARKPRLTYYQIESGSIFSKNKKEFSGIKILYNDNEISDELIFLKMLIYNNGGCDIDKNIIFTPLTISFGDSTEILDVYVNKKYKILCQNNNKEIVFKWNLLKRKEFFLVHVVLKYKGNDSELFSSHSLKDATNISCRITNLSHIKKINTPTLTKNNIGKYLRYSIFCVLIGISILIDAINELLKRNIIQSSFSFFTALAYLVLFCYCLCIYIKSVKFHFIMEEEKGSSKKTSQKYS